MVCAIGLPLIDVLDEDTARGFFSAPPPPNAEPWVSPLGGAYGVCIEQGAILVRHSTGTVGMPDSLRPHFVVQDGLVPVEAWYCGVEPQGDLSHLVENIGAALSRKPEELAVIERHPSRQAARKQGLNPDHVPTVEYVIGADIPAGVQRGRSTVRATRGMAAR